MIPQIIDALIVQSLAGGGVILITLIMRKLFSRGICARLMYALWLVAALRLLIPLEIPGIPVRINNVANVPAYETRVQIVEETHAAQQAFAIYPAIAAPSTNNSVAKIVAPAKAKPSWREIAPYIWLSGAFLTSAYMIFTNRRFRRRLNKTAIRISAPGYLPVFRADIDSPCLAGIFAPRIYVNANAVSPETLAHVIAHESSHAKVFDNLWLLIRNAICALYWFHPLVWLAASLSARDCESACDERVTRFLSKSDKVSYARTLIKLSGKSPNFAVLSGMSSGKTAVKNRVVRILKRSADKRWVSWFAAILLMIISIFSCATGENIEYEFPDTSGANGTLVIANLGNDSRARYMVKRMREKYPEIDVSYVYIDPDNLAAELKTNENHIDIVYGHIGLMTNSILNGNFAPIDGMAGLMGAMEAADFVNYKPALTYNGSLYGVADEVYQYAFRLNEPLLAELGLKWPASPYSWTELADWAIPALSGTDYKLFSAVNIDPAKQYADMAAQRYGEISLDAPEYLASVEAYERLVSAGLIGGGMALATSDVLYFGAYAPMPTLEGIAASPAEISGFFVSANTKNIDIVEAFLIEYVSKDCQNNVSYGLPFHMLLRNTNGYIHDSFDYREETDLLRLSGYDSIILKDRSLRRMR